MKYLAITPYTLKMVKVSLHPEAKAVSIDMPETVGLKVSREHFLTLAAANKDIKLEGTAEGELSVNPLTG